MTDHINNRCPKRVRGGRNPSLAPGIPNGKAVFHNACAVCGRRFAVDRLLKHQAICRRNSNEHRAPLKNITAVVESLVEPINSNWRLKRDEMKRRIGANKSDNKAKHTDVTFELVLKPVRGNELHASEPSAWLRQEFVSPITDVLVVLDDSLDEIKDKPILEDLPEADSIASMRSLVTENATSNLNKPNSRTSSSPRKIQDRAIVSETKEATAWTIEWPGKTSLQSIPTKFEDSKSVANTMDPRALLEPVRFEFRSQRSRTKSSYAIPTDPGFSAIRSPGNVLQPARDNNQAMSHVAAHRSSQSAHLSGKRYNQDCSLPSDKALGYHNYAGQYASPQSFAPSIRFNYGLYTLGRTVHKISRSRSTA
jgi:hypothetical protein